jgi:PKD domain/Secretion system C-terminal sorting domain
LSSALFLFVQNGNSQLSSQVKRVPFVPKTAVIDFSEQPQVYAKTASTSITDTLWYSYNKHVYRNISGTGLIAFQNPSPNNTTVFTHCGTKFFNSGTLSINGLECLIRRIPSSPSLNVPVRMYLCNVASNLPVFPPIDSLTVFTSSLGATFVGASWATPKIVTGDYAVLLKTVTTVVGDSVYFILNDAMTVTSTAMPTSARYGEGLGLVRLNGVFYPTTNGFSVFSSDYEFIVAPRVSFVANTTQSSTAMPALCTNTAYVFNNTSSAWLGHRQYNLNEFYRRWKPFANTVATINDDSVYTWNFGDGSGNQYTASGINSVAKTYTTVGNYSVTLTSKYKKMANVLFTGLNTSLMDVASASKTTSNCAVTNTSNVGFSSQSITFQNFQIFPNPSINGKFTLSGLSNTNRILVYNLLGQLVLEKMAYEDTITIELPDNTNTAYIVKIIDSYNNQSKMVKIINQN